MKAKTKNNFDSVSEAFFNDLEELCLTVTKKLREESERSSKSYSKKSAAIRELIVGTSFGCQTNDVIKLVEAIIGEPIERSSDSSEVHDKFSVIILSQNYVDYKKDEATMVAFYKHRSNSNGIIFSKSKVVFGPHLPTKSQIEFRYATDKEIGDLFVKLKTLAIQNKAISHDSSLKSFFNQWMDGKLE